MPSGCLPGSRRLAVQLSPLLASLPQTMLLVWAPSLLSPGCLLLYLERRRDSSGFCVALPQHSSCHPRLHHCGLFHWFSYYQGSFHAVSCVFVFGMITNAHVYPLDEGFISSKGLVWLLFHSRRRIIAKMIK